MSADLGPPTQTIAFLGGGHMARALIGGLIRRGLAPDRIRVGEPLPAVRAALTADFGVSSWEQNAEALDGAGLVVLAVKPQQAAAVLQGACSMLERSRPVLLSIAAGLRIADLARLAPAQLPIVRAMPNRPALLAAGITGLYAPEAVSPAQRTLVEQVTASAGRSVWLRAEAELDVVTALSGSGPAYFFLLAECLAKAGAALGLEPATAALLAAETLYGAGQLAHGEATLAAQRAAVTSRGGTTEAALRVLDEAGFEALIARVLHAATRRSAELAAQLAATGRGSP